MIRHFVGWPLGQQFQIEQVRRILKPSGVPPHYLILEDVLIQSGQYFFAENDGCIAGCGGVSLSLDEETSAEIRGFFVAPEYARKGVASSMFNHCEKYCSERGVKSLFLASTLSGEPYYRKRGFTEIGRVKEPLSNGQFFDLVNMEKKL